MEKESGTFGLTDEEVLQIRRMGGGNPPLPAAGSVGQIVREHVCALFNLFNVLIAAALAAVGAWSNLLFLLVIALNTLIGIAQALPDALHDAVRRGRRVLLAAHTAEPVRPDCRALPPMTPLAALVLADPVRPDAADTLAYFRREGVAVKILSGDHPLTAAAVAERAAALGMRRLCHPQAAGKERVHRVPGA